MPLRAVPVASTEPAKLVTIKSPTVVGIVDKDPYGTVQPIIEPAPDLPPTSGVDPAPPDKAPDAGANPRSRPVPPVAVEAEVRRAVPVAPAPENPAPPVRIDPPDPLQFN